MKKHLTILFVLLFCMSSYLAMGQLVHPGVMFNKSDLDRMKARLNIDPWKSGFAALSARPTASINYVMQGPFKEVGREPDVNRSQYETDMAAVEDQAIMWYMTGNSVYAQKAIQIIDAWSTTHTVWSGTTWSGLERGLFGMPLAMGAEILRYNYPGWTATETNNCNNYFLNMYWNPGGPWTDPVNDNLGTGNQGQATVAGMMAVAIALDDTAKYNYMINAFRNNTCVSLNRSTLSTGQNGEIGRDQGHAMIEVYAMTDCAEIASKQGTDLYSDLNNRLLSVCEYWTSYQMGNTVPYSVFGPCSGAYNGISSLYQGQYYPNGCLEQIYGIYALRRGLPAPYTAQYRAMATINNENFLFDQDAVPATPGSPANLAASVGYAEIVLDWGATNGALSYNIKRATTSGGPYTTIAAGVSGTTYIDKNVTNGTVYYYVVSATGSAGEGPNSGQIAARPQTLALTDVDMGGATPSGSASFSNGTWSVSGSGSDINSNQYNYAYLPMIGNGSITARVISGSRGKIGIMMRGSLTVSLSQFVMAMYDSGNQLRLANRLTNGDANVYYQTLSSPAPPGWLRLVRNGPTFTAYYSSDGQTWTTLATVSEVLPTNIYVGLAVCGRGTLVSATFDNLTVKGIALAPTNLTATPVSGSQINLAWQSSPDAASYNVYRAPVSGGPYTLLANGVTTNAYADNGLSKGTYYYVVTSVNLYGEGTYSSEVSGTPLLDSPSGLTATAGNAQAFLRWNAVIGATSYKLKRSTTSGSGYTVIAAPTSAIYNDTTAVNGMTYYYVVSAIGSSGESTNSAQASVVPSASAPATLFWSGAVNGTWDLTTANWKKGTTASAYAAGSAVWFDDSVTGNTAITLSAAMSPLYTVFNNSTASYTLSGSALSGSMILTKTGTGTLTLSVGNSFTGGTVLSSGSIAANAATALGTGPVTLNGGTLQLFNNNLTISNNLVAAGTATVASGTQSGFKGLTWNGVLSGNGTVSFVNNSINNMPFSTTAGGNWSAFTGTLIYDEGLVNKNFAWTFTPVLDLRNGAMVIQNTVNQGNNALTLNGTGTSYIGALSQLGTNSTRIALANTDTLSVGNLAATSTYGGIISGAGAFQLTGGSLTLSGINTYTGPTTVKGGKLNINGSLTGGGVVTVNSGATIGGKGTIACPTVLSANGKISLQDGTNGLLTISQMLTLNGGSSVDLDLGGVSTSDQIKLTGGYTGPSSGAVTIDLAAISGFGNGTYTLISGATGINPNVFNLGNVPSGYTYALTASNGNLNLVVSSPPQAPNGLTGTAVNKTAGLSWASSSTATSYHVMRTNTSGGPYTVVSNTSITSFTDSLVSYGNTYYYVVSALNNAGESPYSSEVSVSIPKGAQSITFNTLNPKFVTDTDFVAGAMASSSLPISYTSSDSTVATILKGKVHITGAGTATITASQTGNAAYLPANPVSQPFTVNKLSQTLTFNSLTRKSVTDTDFNAGATASSGLTPGYASSDSTVATILNGKVHITGAGTTTITASQAGNATYLAATALSQSLTVNKLSQALTFNAIAPKTVADTDFDAGATASSGLTPGYTSSDSTVATIVNGKVHITGAGTASITASQGGSAVYLPATPVSQNLVVSKLGQAITFAPLAPKTTGDPDFDAGATASSGLNVIYTSSDTTVAAPRGNLIHIIGAGVALITANQPGNNKYAAAAALSQQLRVKNAQTITFAALSPKLIGDPDFSLNAISSSGLPVTYSSSDSTIATITGNIVHIRKVGSVVITAMQSGNTTYSAAANVSNTLTVSALNLALQYLNNDYNNPSDNNIKPQINLVNSGTAAINYSEITVRYWFTAENYAGINTWVDYAQMGSGHIALSYVPATAPLSGALGYIQYTFDSSSGSLTAGGQSGPIQARFANKDWSVFNETDDYSYLNVLGYTANSHITVYRNGVLVLGTEPAAVPVNTRLNVTMQTVNTSAVTNTISNYLMINNTGNQAVSYGDLSVRYWFTADGTATLNYYLDYAKLGNANITGRFTKLATPLQNADTYLELTFNNTGALLYPLSTTGNIQHRIAKSDWSNFTQSNDYSFASNPTFAVNNNMTVYYKGQLIFGVEPTAGNSVTSFAATPVNNGVAKTNTDSSVSSTNMLYPNPMTGTFVFVRTTPDLSGKLIQTRIVDLRTGTLLFNKTLQNTEDNVLRIDLNRMLSPGIYSVQLNQLPSLKLMVQ